MDGGRGEYASDEARWAAVAARDARADGAFCFAVVTTGIYCRPSCPARRPRRANVRFFASADAAARAGFRACKRCRPDMLPLPAARFAEVCRWVEAQEEMPNLAAMAREAGLSPAHFHRSFRRAVGVTPKQFTDAILARRVESALESAPTVTGAIYGAGFTGASAFYRRAGARLGMTPARRRTGGDGTAIRWAAAEVSLGTMLVAATAQGVCAILLGDDAAALVGDLRARFPRAAIRPAGPDSDLDAWLRTAVALADRPGVAAGLPLDVRGTAFQEKVWRILQSIPPGETRTYGEIAAAAGRPGAARAVGAACAANPVAIAIPCHRAVPAGGGLAGYRWGVARKKTLLAREKRKP